MPLTCPHCSHPLPAADEPLRFCPFCGARLADAAQPDAEPPFATTAEFAASAVPQPPEEFQPDAIGGYRVVRLLGVGGMGRVYEAEWPSTGQRVAVKLLSAELATNPVSLERFRQEGRLASQLHHPHCVFVLAADTDHGRPYIVMELMPGDTLKDLVDRRGPLPPQEAIRLIIDVIDGLREAHRLGVIHRDIKPSNCFLMQDGRVKIGDFGLSKSLTSTKDLTQSGAFLGTVLYASPEQIRGDPVDYASDVYSVCATLFHLLTGQAPFQHENVTAALSRIISEDPPPVRSLRPEVSAALARVVERGLERDRARRYQTLGELRAALVALVPEQLTFGGLGIRVAAYLLDEVLVGLLLVIPLAALLRPVAPFAELPVLLQVILAPIYFIVLEGRWGASLGKRLLGLRVCRPGTTDPPGMLQAALRTVIFALLINVTLAQPRILVNQLSEEAAGPHLLWSGIPFVFGLLLLMVPMRRSNDFRGLHEMLSGTCVLRLPRPPRPLRLTGGADSPLLALPPRKDPLPKAVGAYPIRAGAAAPDGSYVLVGEDAILGRQLLMRVRPSGEPPLASRHAVTRPTRLRFLQSGTTSLQGVAQSVEVFVAPAGRPLDDICSPARKLSWRETQPILEQLADELAAAEADGTLPPLLSVDQVWVQADGRLQLLDFPLPGAKSPRPALGALDLLRLTATLALEGRVRMPSTGDSIRAAVPRHAARLLRRLFGGPKPFPDAGSLRAALVATDDEPTGVNQAMRLAQLGLQALFLAPGLLTMFAVSGLFGAFSTREHMNAVRADERLLAALAAPEVRGHLAGDPRTAPSLAQPHFAVAVVAQLQRDRAALADQVQTLGGAERAIVRLSEARADLEPGEPSDPDLIEAVRRASGLAADPSPRHTHWREAAVLIVGWPLAWAVGAFVLRGGASLLLMGMAVVRTDGRKATRLQCGTRALIVWLPVATLLAASLAVYGQSPEWLGLRSLLWWGALGIAISFVFVAVSLPERAPHDRWLRLQLVPR